MDTWIEHKYINLISYRFRNFKRKSSNLYNFSCPLCGDSEKSKYKARAYIFQKQGKLIFHCHNCNATRNISTLIKDIEPSIYNEYVVEKIKEQRKDENSLTSFVDKLSTPKYLNQKEFNKLKKISQLNSTHSVKQFVIKRQIPNEYHRKLFICPNFKHFVNTLIPNKFDENSLQYDETRLLIPFIDSNQEIFAFQGRSLRSDSKVKYITIILDESIPKIYGLDTVNFNKTVYVFEGPIDSMFIKNSIATAGGDLVSSLESINKDNLVICYDNERYSVDTVNKIQKAILQGYRVCIWPDALDIKDINDMIISGMDSETIKSIIDVNTFQGLSATLRINLWKRI